MGNVVLWKPSSLSVLSNFFVYQCLMEAGLPNGVIQFLPGSGKDVMDIALSHPEFAGLHFTGSTAVFKQLWAKTGHNLNTYRSFPRLVGETGGKNFHVVHESANVPNVVNQTIRSAFEYQGQKCSACSRMYVPDRLWPEIRRRLVEEHGKIRVGPVDGAFL